MGKYIQVFTTVDSKKSAARIADALVNEGLAACVQVIGPMRSTYMWKGRKERATEWLCIIKSKRALYGKIEGKIRSMHSYSLPEITMTEISGDKRYLAWIDNWTR
ncbi:MAG: divalent-cation tolerance protein CutA [Candidatus Micrarchaeales archaeon]|nr:divalent-cation tolerance protein CutA [Candidatus Micrarchaeales archaeon]